MSFIFFNLLINSIFSLVIGIIIIYFFIGFFRVETGGWKVFLLSLPFLKILYDFIRGVPKKSILFSGIDPFNLPPKHQLLSIGAGFGGWTPFISTVFSVNGPNGKVYHSSIGDYVVIWIHRTLGENIPLIIVSLVMMVSFYLLAIRIIQYYRFEKQRQRDRMTRSSLKELQIGKRKVDIYISSHFSGTPFTGGILKPYICLPKDAVQKLNPSELEAVIAHEMGHIRHYDLLVTIFIQGLGDFFWFIPGYRWLSRKIDRLREIVADNWAISNHIKAHCLASTLIKLADMPQDNEFFVPYSAFFREKSLLKERIERLVGNANERSSRFGWRKKWVKCCSTFFISIVVLNSVFGGNFSDSTTREIPKWVEKLLMWKN